MNEYKFRGKRVDNDEWIYGYYVFEQLTEEHNILVNVDNPYDNLNWHEVYPNTVGQYTGLKDKNGVEIYEGDKVSCRGGERWYGTWEYNYDGIIEELLCDFVFHQILGHGYELVLITGNIHEEG